MNNWIKRSEREPTAEDFKVGVRYGSWEVGYWRTSHRVTTYCTHELWLKNCTHWQLDPAPEPPRKPREWWICLNCRGWPDTVHPSAEIARRETETWKQMGSVEFVHVVEWPEGVPVPERLP
jgi:hypothetical protein